MENTAGGSSLGKVLSSQGPLSLQEWSELSAIEEPPLTLKKDSIVYSEKSPSHYLFTLEEGWACAYRTAEDRSRQLYDVFVPGDLIGLREFSLDNNSTEVIMLTDGRIAPTPKTALIDSVHRYRSLADRLLAILIYQHNIISDRLKSYAHHDATTRIIHLILELNMRCARHENRRTNCLNIPLSQSLIGALLGMTGVHVSRCFSYLEEHGLIQKEKGKIKILNYKEMVGLSHFESDFLSRESELGNRIGLS
ncbi:Crp/Fnr family transcriptional regulator [Litchfieldella xinjiangensis]|uniref:Crp/Fnr family transcriptional regulator n=1 Tax=Litchfieldella xinjiangensis TaxID=1166948 RepID=UPI0018CFDF97|nr:Crp/Fnr family transcriptional regulator [Halomonas xinjiangensis]